MNVIVIVSDTLRRDHVPAYAGQVIPPDPRLGEAYSIYAPHLRKLGEESLVFDNAWTASFPTVPCRNDLMTGRYTYAYKPWSPLGSSEIILSETLNKAGYMTALFADTPHPFAPGFNYQRGFKAWELMRGQEGDPWKTSHETINLPAEVSKFRGKAYPTTQYLSNMAERQYEEDYFPARTARAAARWLEKNYKRPFFLYVDTFDPHEPWDPPEHYVRRYMADYAGEAVIYPRYDTTDYLTADELRYCRALYAGEVSLVDHWVGYLLERVEDLGILEDTVVIFMADHGFYLGEHGYIGKSIIASEYQQPLPLYPEVSRVPFMVRMPGNGRKGRVNGFVQPVDVMPTVLDLLGVEIPKTVQGHSIVPMINGETEQVRPFCIASPTIAGPHVSVPHPANRMSVVMDDWLLIFGSQADEPVDAEYTQMVDSIRRQIRMREPMPVLPELYRLSEDPNCMRNVITAHYDVARTMHAHLVAHLKAIGVEQNQLAYFDSFPDAARWAS